jgi:hypothetical protein
MIEGWHNEDYLVLFDETESREISHSYCIDNYFGGFAIVGLKGWDDFIIEDALGSLFTVPTVPIERSRVVAIDFQIDRSCLRPDERVLGKIKWYTKPLIFGGDANVGENIIWVTLEQHVQLVNWWNELYLKMKASNDNRK